MLGAFLTSVGARDQVLLAALAMAPRRHPAFLLFALIAAAGTSALAAWIGGGMLGELAPGARALFMAIALILGGGEMLLLAPRPAPREPTASLFAAALVFTAMQITDAARFLVLAVAIGTAAPVTAGLGGAFGSIVALVAAWAAPQLVATPHARRLRRAIGAILLLMGLGLGIPNVIGFVI